MKNITPEIVEANEKLFNKLENKGIIKRFIKGSESIKLKPERYNVKKIYSTDSKYGGHKLICVNYNLSEPALGYHEEKEDFILVADSPDKYKNLYLLVCLMPINLLLRKITNNSLNKEDFLIIKMEFNNPLLSFFTMNKRIPHCELTDKNSQKINPYFFVTEPTHLENNLIDLKKYIIKFDN